ncbi:uncharacterized protein LOC122267594 [Penaeus japonicus]|uniref:uncharacterized protein LOC122267594 n=1 Tax=Penaeus japonicus TaxID=27405 RepID=UPI001C715490|nr:uncharacterized protein LOC122267594 [Penaeus japonicus]
MLDNNLTDQNTNSNCSKESNYAFLFGPLVTTVQIIIIALSLWTIKLLHKSTKIIDRLAIVQSVVISVLLTSSAITGNIRIHKGDSLFEFFCYAKFAVFTFSILFIVHNNTAMIFIRYLYIVFPIHMQGRNTTVTLRIILLCLFAVTTAKCVEHLFIPGKFLLRCLRLPTNGPSWRVNTTSPCFIAGFYFYGHILYTVTYKRNFRSNQQTKTLVSLLANFAVFVVIMVTLLFTSVLIPHEKCLNITSLGTYAIVIDMSKAIIALGYILLSSEIRKCAWKDLRLIFCFFRRKQIVQDQSKRMKTEPELPKPKKPSFLDTLHPPRDRMVRTGEIPEITPSMASSNETKDAGELVQVHVKEPTVEEMATDAQNNLDDTVSSETNRPNKKLSIIMTKAVVSSVLPEGTDYFGSKRNTLSAHSSMPPVD